MLNNNLCLKGTLKSHLNPFPYILKTTAILCWHLYWCCVIFLNKHSIIGEVLVGLSLFAGIFFCISVFHCWSSIKFPVTLPRRRTKFQKVARFQNWLVFKSINNEASLLTNIFQLVDRLDRLIDWWSPIYFVQTKHLKNLYVQNTFLDLSELPAFLYGSLCPAGYWSTAPCLYDPMITSSALLLLLLAMLSHAETLSSSSSSILELQTIHRFSQSCRRPPIGPPHSWKCLSHFRHY